MNLTSPSQVKEWCIQRGFHPNRTLGQNFLIDHNILNAIGDAAELRPGARVLEVGPGLGVVTAELLARGAEVVAVEKDHRLVAWLRESMGGEARLTLLAGDMLEMDIDDLLARRFDAFVSNLPYSVGTRILIQVALHALAPPRLTVMVQQEVAARLAAGPDAPDRGQSGVWLQRLYDVTPVRTVKPSCFWPRPEVASTIVTLARHARHPLPPEQAVRFQELTRHAFMHRRKQLGAALRHLPAPLAVTDAMRLELFIACGIDPRARAENLTLAQWCVLASHWPDSVSTGTVPT
jgi:16S rRNA (adenine1518-N6/adenine1519-N6)-dimethyltransferase